MSMQDQPSSDKYFVSLPNPGTDGVPKFLRSSDQPLIKRWIEAEDRPGFGVYYCPNPLKPDVARHGRDSTEAIGVLYVDIRRNREAIS